MSRHTFTCNVVFTLIVFVGIISRVNTALGTLQCARAGMIAEKRHGVLSLREKMSAAFTRKQGSGRVNKPSKCDLLSENPALCANIEFELQAVLSVLVVFKLKSYYCTNVLVLWGACTVSYKIIKLGSASIKVL